MKYGAVSGAAAKQLFLSGIIIHDVYSCPWKFKFNLKLQDLHRQVHRAECHSLSRSPSCHFIFSDTNLFRSSLVLPVGDALQVELQSALSGFSTVPSSLTRQSSRAALAQVYEALMRKFTL